MMKIRQYEFVNYSTECPGQKRQENNKTIQYNIRTKVFFYKKYINHKIKCMNPTKSTETSIKYQPMVDTQSAQFKKISNPASRIELIKQSGQSLFELLSKSKLKLQLPLHKYKQQLAVLYNYFPVNQSKWDHCMNKVKYCNLCIKLDYRCRTCVQEEYICQECFDKQYHKNHLYYTQNLNVECQCGTFNLFENKCNKHKYPQQPYSHIKDIPPEYQLFVAFITEFFTLFIQEKTIDHGYQIFLLFIDFLISVCKQSKNYCHAVTYSLSLSPCPQNNSSSILKLLLQKNISNHFLPNSTIELFKLLINMVPFQILLLESIQKLTLKAIHNLDSLALSLQKLPLAIQLAKRNKLLSADQRQRSVNLYQTLLHGYYFKYNWEHPTPELMDRHRRINLTPIFRLFMRKTGQNLKYIQNLFKRSCISSFIMKHIALHGEHDLLVDIFVYELNRKVYKNNSNKQSDSSWYNNIIQAILYLYKGSIKQFPLFFQQVDKQKLKQFICNYFQRLFKIRQKCHFNITSATCLIETAKYYNIYQQIKESGIQLDINMKISCLQFSKNLSIVLRNLITGQYVLAEVLKTIAAINNNKAEQHKNNKIMIDWLRNYLHSSKQVNKYKIKQMKDSNRINFPEAMQLIQHQTTYIKQTEKFKYKGPSITCGQYYQYFQQRIPEQKKYSFFHTQNRYQILQLMLKDGIKCIEFSKFKSYPNRIKKEIVWNAAVLLSIMGNTNQNGNKCQFAVQYFDIINQACSGQRKKIQFLEHIYQQQQKNNQISIQKQDKMIESKDEKQNMKKQLNNPNQQIQIMNKNTNKQQKIEEKMNDQQKKKCQKVLSALEAEIHKKRTNKIQRIKQKFNKKSIRYSDYLKSHEFEHQVCLICRETTSKNKQKSFLYYLASLKSDELTQLIYGLQGNQLNLTTCFHPFHLKCLNNNISNCTLCRINGNFILPILDESHESQMFTRAWWDDFISMADFKPKPANMYNYYGYNSYQNNATSNAKQHEQKKQAMQKLKARPYKNFIIIYRYLIMRLGSITTKTKWQDSIKKNHYFYQLIKFYYAGLNQIQRRQCYQKILNASIMTHQAIQLLIVASQALTLKLQGLQTNIEKCLEIKDKCKYIVKKYQPLAIDCFMKNIQWLLQSSLELDGKKSVRSVGLTLLDPSSISKIFAMSIPKTMQDVYSLRNKCPKCNKIGGWLCIFCKKTGCISCDNASNHSKQSHNGNTILMVFLNQGKLTTATSSSIQCVHLYFDKLFINFDEYYSRCQLLKQYKYDSSILCQNVQKIFKKYF